MTRLSNTGAIEDQEFCNGLLIGESPVLELETRVRGAVGESPRGKGIK